MSMAKTLMTWRWLAAAALLLAPALAFATGDAEQSAPASAGAGAAMSGRFSEAPMLAARVAAGELPPVQERIPVDPVVQEMLGDGVGRYGGTLRVSEAVGFMNQRGGELTTQMLDIYLLTMHQETLDIAPNIAAGYAVADDGLTVTLELRPGTRWSNGDPFIVDDRPTAATIHSTARFYKPQWQWLWAEHDPEQAGRLLDEVGLTGRDRDGFRTFPDGSNLTIQVAARTGGPVDISKLFELEIAQWAEVDLRVVPRLVDDAAWGDNIAADEFMLQPGGIDAITEFWNWINAGPGSAGVGLHGDFNMTGSYDEWENARRLIERGERKLSDYGGELPGIEPPDEWKRYFDWQRQFRTGETRGASPGSAPASGSSWRRRCSTSPATTCS